MQFYLGEVGTLVIRACGGLIKNSSPEPAPKIPLYGGPEPTSVGDESRWPQDVILNARGLSVQVDHMWGLFMCLTRSRESCMLYRSGLSEVGCTDQSWCWAVRHTPILYIYM